jgi:glycosyltransferase involved in cell wall biosynthesis
MVRLARVQYRIASERVKLVLPGYVPDLLTAASELHQQDRLLVYAGRVTFSKGLRELLLAFANLAGSSARGWRLRIVGDGRDRPALAALAKSRGIAPLVDFTGSVDPRVSLEHLAQASVVVLPSYMEGVPLTVIEAMALGRPVVATDVGAISAHLITNGKTGLLCRPRSTESLQEALRTAMANPTQTLAIGAAGQRVAGPLTTHRMVELTEKAYRAALAASRA